MILLALAFTHPVAAGGSTGSTGKDPASTPSADKEREYKVKAASIYHFLRYTTWPEDSYEKPDSPIEVLVVGTSPIWPALEKALAGKAVSGRKVTLARVDDVPGALSAHFVIAGDLDDGQRAKLRALAETRPCFLFGDRPGYARAGACGNFLIEDGKVRFELNTESLKSSRLEVSSQLLKLARIVKTEKGDGK